MAILTSSDEHNEVKPVSTNQHFWGEMDGAGQVVELQEQGVQELEHLEAPVELQAHQRYHRDEASN